MGTRLNVVVVEDHDILREATVLALQDAGYRAIGVDCAEALADEGARARAEVYVIDVHLPGEDGLGLARRLRAAQPRAGIVMLTARGELDDRLAGYRSGADLYLTKPVDPAELLAAIDALSKRLVNPSEGSGAPAAIAFVEGLRRLDGPRGTETLTRGETTLLVAFVRSRDRRLETWQLMEALGEDPRTYAKAALEIRILRLRQKLVRVGADDGCLRALRGEGYQLGVAVRID